MPHEVTMPQLGMAQDTGLIVSWTKTLGDPIRTGDVLLEVETDKSTMELEAAHDGFLAEVRAEAGQAVPVGDIIAVISESAADVATGNAAQLQETGVNGATPASTPIAPTREAPEDMPPVVAAPQPTAPASPGDRILASAKAKYVAAQKGIDLRQLVRRGASQPIHVADLQQLAETTRLDASPGTPSASTLSATVDRRPMAEFVAWTSEIAGSPIEKKAVWLNFATRVLRNATGLAPADGILCEHARYGTEDGTAFTADADRVVLSCIRTTDAIDRVADIRILDLSQTRISDYRPAASCPAPTIVLGSAADGCLTLSLHFCEEQLPLETAIALLNDLAGHAAEPMKHIL